MFAPVAVNGGDWFEARCRVCGTQGRFERFERDGPSFRESYRCPSCRALHRYQGQADLLLQRYASTATSVAELVREPAFRKLDIYEPGQLGPFRPLFRPLRGYVTSQYWPDVEPGKRRRRIRCEDLMALTFADESFDLVITSDVFEHIRHPWRGFGEVYRVLRPGKAHIFSIPTPNPMRATTGARVDVTGEEDVPLLPERYHNGHLVYNDFGLDIVDRLAEIGFTTDVVASRSTSTDADRLLTFCSSKAGDSTTVDRRPPTHDWRRAAAGLVRLTGGTRRRLKARTASGGV